MSRSAESAFLPAALEIQETPPSPAGRAILWIIMAFFILTLLWAVLSEVDIVSVAQGRIIPSGHSKTVQPLEIGTVSAIHIAEGQAVKAGDVLIQLDTSSAQADVDRLSKELATAQQEVSRYQQLAQKLEPNETRPAPVWQAEDALLIGQWQEFQDKLAVLQHEKARQIAEQRSAQRQVDKLQAILPIVTRRAEDQEGLAGRKMLAEQQYLETEQQRLQIFHDLKTQQGRVSELKAAIDELDAKIGYTHSEFHRQVLERLEEAQRRTSATTQELRKAQTRVKAHTLTAPVDGVVQQLVVHNIGAIVTPAQELMVIVPQGEKLEVEAVLENKDIGFVEVGQQAEIKVDTFPFTKYGTIAGEVVNISNDAVTDEQKGLVYKMRVLMQHPDILVNGKQVTLSPGMTVTVESKTGTRKMIEFFLSPLLRYSQESARER